MPEGTTVVPPASVEPTVGATVVVGAGAAGTGGDSRLKISWLCSQGLDLPGGVVVNGNVIAIKVCHRHGQAYGNWRGLRSEIKNRIFPKLFCVSPVHADPAVFSSTGVGRCDVVAGRARLDCADTCRVGTAGEVAECGVWCELLYQAGVKLLVVVIATEADGGLGDTDHQVLVIALGKQCISSAAPT